jgi:hypothetical protein
MIARLVEREDPVGWIILRQAGDVAIVGLPRFASRTNGAVKLRLQVLSGGYQCSEIGWKGAVFRGADVQALAYAAQIRCTYPAWG